MAYNTLFKEQGFLILNNLKKFDKSPEIIKNIITLLEPSELAFMIPLFESGYEYYERNKEFPAGRFFLSGAFAELFVPTKKLYSEDVYNDFYRTLRVENVSAKSRKELDNGNLEIALATLSEFNSIRSNKKERFDPNKYIDFYNEAENKGQGMNTGIVELDNILKGYDYGSLNIVAAPPAAGKCCPYDTSIHTNKGYLNGHQLENYVDFSSTDGTKKEGTFYPFKKNILVRDNQVSDKFYYNGYVDTINIKSKYFEMGATPIHRVKVLTNEGVDWKQFKDIEIGDWVCCDNKVDILFNNETPKPSFLKHLTEREYGWFVGFFMGDGSLGYGKNGKLYQLSFTKLEQILDYIKDELVSNVSWCKNKKPNSEVAYSITYNSAEFLPELVDLGVCGTSYIKKLPDWVYSSNKEFLIGLLSGYVDADGGIESGCISISSMSDDLIKGIRDIFNLLGVFPILEKKNGRYKGEKIVSNRLTVTHGYKHTCQFLDLKVDYKKEAYDIFLNKETGYNTKFQIPYVETYKQEIESLYKTYIEPVYSYTERREMYCGNISIREHARGNDGREVFTKYGWDNFNELLSEEAKDNQINRDLKEYQFFQVEEITHGKAETFDISVPTTNTYTANGIVSHNTTYGVSVAYNAVMNENKNFIFFSLEVMDRHVYYSFLSRHSKELGMPIPSSEMKKSKLNKQQKMWYEIVGKDFNERIKDKLFIITQDDFETFSPSSIEKIVYECDSICKERGEQLDGYVFDYLQLTKYYKPPTIKDEKETMNYYTRYLLELATSFNGRGMVGILLAQLNRTGSEQLKKNKDASLFSFAEANELERSAHTAVVLYASDEMKMSNNVNFYLVKNRIGTTNSTPTTVVCDFAYYKMGNTTLSNVISLDNEYLIGTDTENQQIDLENQFNSLLSGDSF